MGCDIHCYKEKFVDGKRIAADEWVDQYGEGLDVKWEDRFTDRNYNLFGLLSKGVRYKHPFSFEPRGMPFDACPEVAKLNKEYGCDGHSHSYLFLHELRSMQQYLATATVKISGLKHPVELAALRASIASPEPTNWELLYSYCQGTSDPTYERFEIDVPASFIAGCGLETLVKMFDGIDGENHRIVFWFDN